MNGKVGIHARQIKQKVAVPDDRRRGLRELADPFHAALTDFPECLQNKRFPISIRPPLRWLGPETLEQAVQKRERSDSGTVTHLLAHVTHQPMASVLDDSSPNLDRDFLAEAVECIRLSNEPAQFVKRCVENRVLQHRHPYGQTSAPQKRFIRLGAEVISQDLFQILRPNSSLGELALKPLIREEGVATKHLAARDDPLFKGKVLERMQCVVMNKRSDRPLRWKQMSSMLDLIPELRNAWQIRTLGARTFSVDEQRRHPTSLRQDLSGAFPGGNQEDEIEIKSLSAYTAISWQQQF